MVSLFPVDPGTDSFSFVGTATTASACDALSCQRVTNRDADSVPADRNMEREREKRKYVKGEIRKKSWMQKCIEENTWCLNGVLVSKLYDYAYMKLK